ncbi:unnamed protein product [Arctia plantaginis]|uniref:Small EDRK-rich factor-like N-terminal domain-containing protein n=2 Tax=Arctia plantaginis TaxID=874455 RepID=A0A8S0Z5E0_ARCPL|nr:unnamed protein product [Arctia plantaginis]
MLNPPRHPTKGWPSSSPDPDDDLVLRMARGQQKIQSQAKAAEKASKLKKQQGHSATDQKKAAQKALVHVCAVCKAQMPDPKTYKQHFENKHPKNDLPEDLKSV